MKPIIVGMNNPISTRPGHELYPAPEGCTGHRLWRMLNSRTGASRLQYLDTFERRNLVRAVAWDRLAARARAYEMMQELRGTGRTVVLLGQSVREAFDFALRGDGELEFQYGLPPLLVHPQEAGGCTWRQVPHPSGRNLWYNAEENRKVVELLMEELYVEYQRRTQAAE
jgi:hypothetical protein